MRSAKMHEYFLIIGVLVYITSFASSEVVFNPHIEQDVCQQLCSNKALNLKTDGRRSQCERGCRLFNIAMNTNWSADKNLDLNATKDQCFQSCSDAYNGDETTHCFTGCSEMFQLQKEAWLFYIEQQGDGGILEVEVSLVSDPALWEQTLGSDGVYKMPQTFIRTMPLGPETSDIIDGKNWTPCTTQSNEIPRWIVALIAVLLTVFTLYVSFILPSRTDSSLIEEGEFDGCRRHLGPEDCSYDGDDLRKELTILYHGEAVCKKDARDDPFRASRLNLVTLNEFLSEDYHVNVVPPPKYTLLPVGEDEEA